MSERSPGETIGMRIVFWVWVAVIAGGLALMIGIPLVGA